MDKEFLKFAEVNDVIIDDKNYCCWLHGYGVGRFRQLKDLQSWAKTRKSEETEHRPDCNIYKKTLVNTWNQIIRKLGGFPWKEAG